MRRIIFIFWIFFHCTLFSQELGSNFNHNPEIIDFHYLQKAEVDWVRTTPRIFDYINGKLKIKGDPALTKVIEAGKRGYKIAFGFRWDFKKNNFHIPPTGSAKEKEYFKKASHILEQVGPYLDIFELGNEPNLETLSIDMEKSANGKVPLVVFTDRLLTQVVLPYYKDHPAYQMPDIYIGSFPALFEKKQQEIPAVNGLLHYAQKNDKITGIDLHLHISDTLEIDQAFKYARGIVKEKPIIVTEFSLHRLYKSKLSEPLNATKKGLKFAKKFRRDPDWKLYQWFGFANTNRVSSKEWKAMFSSRSWYPEHYLNIYFRKFKKYGVVLATYPLFQQSCPKNMTVNSSVWFANPIFCQKDLKLQAGGSFSPNPLCFKDFVELVNKHKKITN